MRQTGHNAVSGIITTPHTAKMLRAMLPGPTNWDRAALSLFARDCTLRSTGRWRTYSLERGHIVTSANLTQSGVSTNLEFGIWMAATSEAGNNLLGARVHYFVLRQWPPDLLQRT